MDHLLNIHVNSGQYFKSLIEMQIYLILEILPLDHQDFLHFHWEWNVNDYHSS